VGLLFFWSLVIWGTLLLGSTAHGVLSDGFGPAIARLLPAPGASAWVWLNALSTALAVAVWVLVLGLLLWFRRGRRTTAAESSAAEDQKTR
jgi:type VI protein secretion system component VasK